MSDGQVEGFAVFATKFNFNKILSIGCISATFYGKFLLVIRVLAAASAALPQFYAYCVLTRRVNSNGRS